MTARTKESTVALHHDRISESQQALSHYFVGEGTFKDTLQRVAHLANEAVGGAAMVGLTMVVEGRAQTAVFTHDDVVEIDQAQYDSGVGPGLDAFRRKTIHRIPDTEKDNPWPQFSEAAAALGVRSTLSMPLVANDEGLGALNFYSADPNAFADEESTPEAFSTQAAIVVANAQAYWEARSISEKLNEALKSRATIEQAKGILMGLGGKSPDEAFEMLVRASQRENRKLRDVAARLVEDAGKRRLGDA